MKASFLQADAIQKYVKRLSLATLEVLKPLETMTGATLSLATLSSDDAYDAIWFYAHESIRGENKVAKAVAKAMGRRGYKTWVSSFVDNADIDLTETDATIAGLITIYPGISHQLKVAVAGTYRMLLGRSPESVSWTETINGKDVTKTAYVYKQKRWHILEACFQAWLLEN